MTHFVLILLKIEEHNPLLTYIYKVNGYCLKFCLFLRDIKNSTYLHQAVYLYPEWSTDTFLIPRRKIFCLKSTLNCGGNLSSNWQWSKVVLRFPICCILVNTVKMLNMAQIHVLVLFIEIHTKL